MRICSKSQRYVFDLSEDEESNWSTESMQEMLLSRKEKKQKIK